MIESISEALGGAPYGAVYALLVLAVVQVAFQVWALVDLARRDRVLYDRKWIWAAAIILLSNFAIGAILYFAIGRRVPEATVEPEDVRDNDGGRAARAVDALYGPKDADR